MDGLFARLRLHAVGDAAPLPPGDPWWEWITCTDLPFTDFTTYPWPSIVMSQITHRSERPLISEAMNWYLWGEILNTTQETAAVNCHRGKANALYHDGHAGSTDAIAIWAGLQLGP